MSKKFVIAWLSAFVVWMGGSVVVHGILLMNDYASVAALYRPEAESAAYMPWIIGATLVMAGAFVKIYERGIEAKPWLGQGIRFGLLVALLTAVPWYTIYYAIQPLPGMMVGKQIVFDTILLLLVGATAAFVYREGKSPA